MNAYNKLGPGTLPPDEIFVVIEVPMNVGHVKYEIDKDSGLIFVDRFLHTSMYYPCNYGFIPQTLAGDGDPVDVLVYANHTVHIGSVITAKPVGVLVTEDEGGQDEKILAVPTAKLDPYFLNINSYCELPEILIQRISHFFEHYKDLEKGKWVKVAGWHDVDHARHIISQAIVKFKEI